MEIKGKILILLLGISVKSTSDSDRISALENRVHSLEVALSEFESHFAARYDLKRHCGMPSVTNAEPQCDDKLESGAKCLAICKPGFTATPGKDIASCKRDGSWSVELQCFRIRNCTLPSIKDGEAWCDDSLTPGAKCSSVCNPGYIATPGKDIASCTYNGTWSVELQCEIPLVLLSGGIVDQGNRRDSGVELLSFYPSNGCERNITNMPLAGGSHRSLHNLIYVPPHSVLACNGMTSKNEATCEELDIKNNTWKHHSYLDKGKGLYAAQSLRLANSIVIAGGMMYDENEHTLSSSIKELSKLTKEWRRATHLSWYLFKQRAFFCSVKIKEAGFLSTGGLGHEWFEKENKVVKTVEYNRVNNGYVGSLGLISHIIDPMKVARSGHGCTVLPVRPWPYDEHDVLYVLVSGGTGRTGQTALADAEIFDWRANSWSRVSKMKNARAGHAVVAVGKKILAIGGDSRNPNKVLDTIEQYDAKKRSWNIIQTKLKKPRSNFGYTLVPHSIFDGCVVEPVHWRCEKYGHNC